MAEHPLTWEVIAEIASDKDFDEYGWYHFNIGHLRAVYDKGMEDRLEQVVRWIQDNVQSQDPDHGWCYLFDDQIEELKEAMRPTTTQEES